MPWTIDYSTPGLADIGDSLADVINAVNERCDAAKVARLKISGIEINPATIGLMEFNDISSVVDTKIDSLFALYADHTQATGTEFTGLATIPAWSEASMLLSIGDSRRYGIMDTTGEWLAQNYKMINNLLWVRHEKGVNFYNPNVPNIRQKLVGATQPNWAAVVTAWGSATFVNVPASDKITSYGMDEATGFGATRECVNYEVATTSALSYSADLYCKTIKPRLPLFGGTATYDAESQGWVEDEFNRFLDGSVSAGSPKTLDVETLIDGIGIPPEPVASGDDTRGWQSSSDIAVLRFDVVGGFTYTQ